MIAANRLREQPADLLFGGKVAAAHEAIKQCIELQPQQSHHLVVKSLVEARLGNYKNAQIDLMKAITLDYLNHHAYFNLASLQMREGELAAVFKNLCCCLSVAHLLRAEREDSLDEVEKAIEYCFNNKEARMLKSILKMQAGKNIEALNQINYALYLAPSHPTLKVVQEKVYRAMGMKELKGKNTPFQKPKYDRLETNKQVPQEDKIKNEIDKLLKEYNAVLKTLDNTEVYKVIILGSKAQDKPTEKAILKEPIKSPVKFYLSQPQQHQAEQNFAVTDSMKEKDDKESTANNSQHVAKQQSFKPTPEQLERAEPFFVLDSSSLSNMSISNISQNSNIKMNKVRGNMVDFSEVGKSFSKEAQSQFPSENNILESSINSEASKGQLKLPLRLSELKNNEKIVVTLQRTVINEQGETEKIEELYEVVQGRSKLQLVKINKQ